MKNKIFSIKNNKEFEKLALEIFKYQAENNNVYKHFVNHLNIIPEKIDSINKIPFLPIEFFKTHKVISFKPKNKKYKIFTSSGTTSDIRSKHIIYNMSIYEKSFIINFQNFYGDTRKYTILALLPSYIENNNSSLIYMVNKLIHISGNRNSGFYMNNTWELIQKLNLLKKNKQKVLLIGVSFALLDLADNYHINFPELTIIETGGMKGRREEITRNELHKILKQKFNVKEIHSEYGMTELLSQAYSYGNEVFETPNWMKIFIRDINDPFNYLTNNNIGGINIIDLANINSCSFIETKDLGKKINSIFFEVLGRYDNSDIRGCNLLF